jgi:hypothetical protein
MTSRSLSLHVLMLICVGFAVLPFAVAEEVLTVQVTADSENTGYDAARAMDGDPATMWHTQFSAPPSYTGAVRPAIPFRCGYGAGCSREHFNALPPTGTDETSIAAPVPVVKPSTGNNVPPPHEFIVDLTRSFEVRGIVQQAREGANNGAIGNYEIYVSNDEPCEDESEEHKAEDHWGEPIHTGTFQKVDTPQTVEFDEPVTCRFVKLVALSELNNQPFTSIAELQILSDGYRFVAEGAASGPRPSYVSQEQGAEWGASSELIDQYNLLAQEFGRPEYYEGIRDQTYRIDAMILPTDRDPTDVVMRRTASLYDDLREHSNVKFNVNEIERRLFPLQEKAAEDVGEQTDRFALYLEICTLRRQIAFGNPLLNFDEILLVKKHRSTFKHMCDQFYGAYTPAGGGLFVLSQPFDSNNPPAVRNLLEGRQVASGRLTGTELNTGAFLSPDLSYDGERIAFAYVECSGTTEHFRHLDLSQGHWDSGRCYHVFTCNADGSDLKQITDGTWNDFDPCFLPNDRIAFITERRGGYLRCGRACPNYTLFDMDELGGRMRCLNYHETNEWNPSVSNDGKILYTRWDYIDRFGCIAHHPWITSIDGRDPRAVHGNFSPRHWRPDGEFDLRAIPGSPKYIATAGPHHGLSFGSLIMIDPQVEDDNAMGPVKRITPEVGFPESQNGGQVIGTAWALSEDYYLAVADYTFQPGSPTGPVDWLGKYGLYLYDSFGNRELIYRDSEIGVASPIPFIPREAPVVAATLFADEEIPHQPYVDHPASPSLEGRPTGTVTIQNVYESMDEWPEDVKLAALRVVQVYTMSVPSGGPPHEIGYREASSPDSVNLARGVLGTVPIEEDGSVHFEVPANCEIYFQVLDENGLAVQSMRSGTCLHEGEQLSCVGCHEPKSAAPSRSMDLPLAFRRPASPLTIDVPGTRPLNFPELIQPILDQHCVECHETPKSREDGAPILAREPIERRWYASYRSLVGGGHAFYNYGDPLRSIPGQVGARASKLYPMLAEGHNGVELSEEELHSFAVWLDLLSNFYGVYEAEGGLAQLQGQWAYPTLE